MAGCETLAFYSQSAAGQLDLWWRARDIAALQSDPTLSARQRQFLQLSREVRRYASDVLGLPDNASYTRYAAVNRRYLVWNVVAAPALSVVAHQWCYPVVGCAAYRGYFRQSAAEDKAAELRAAGLETAVMGVPAYSTLGWFDDPVPSTIAHWPAAEVARLLFHELAHQQLYLSGDSGLNEAFATVVAEAGVQRWLADSGRQAQQEQFNQRHRKVRAVTALLLAAREDLHALYQSDSSAAQKRATKTQRLTRLKSDYLALSASWNQGRPYAGWFKSGINNAHLATIATYHALADDLRQLLQIYAYDLPTFYQQVAKLEALTPTQRRQWLRSQISAVASQRNAQ